MDFIAQLSHADAHLADRNEPQYGAEHSAREKGLSLAEGSRTNLKDQFIQKAEVVELTSKIAASNDPDVFTTSSSSHLGMDLTHIAVDKLNVCTVNCW